tara:strand:- start:5021 stop:5527 length:507 start_codon:yes stop_codon:yes gene_type:complete
MISHLLSDDVDFLYIHIIPKFNINNNILNLTLDKSFINKITSNYKFINDRNMVYYYRKNIYYSYDTSNDSQNCFRFELLNSEIIDISDHFSICINVYKEIKLPCYMFPSTSDIDHKTSFQIKEFKVNNRITLTNKNNKSLYLLYKHSPNVDIDKNISDLQNLFKHLNI